MRKFVEPEFVQPLKVPEAGTQSRGKLKGQDMRPRSTISTVKPAPSGTLVSYPHEWQQEIKQLQTMLNTRESQLEDKEAELRDALMKLQELRKQGRPSRQEADKGLALPELTFLELLHRWTFDALQHYVAGYV